VFHFKIFPTLLDKVDMVSGCSNGGMIAMSIAYGYSPASSRELLETSGNWLFRKKNSNLKKAKYSNDLLKIFCDEVWKQWTYVATALAWVIAATQCIGVARNQPTNQSTNHPINQLLALG
jgi:patatin-like phospholipase/acyl hydrolase